MNETIATDARKRMMDNGATLEHPDPVIALGLAVATYEAALNEGNLITPPRVIIEELLDLVEDYMEAQITDAAAER